MNLNPKKLKHSKWTAVKPQNREKHFMVIRLILPTLISAQIEEVELQAIHSGRSFTIPWHVLKDNSQWLQGWVA